MPRYTIYFTYKGAKEVEEDAENELEAERKVREKYRVLTVVSVDELPPKGGRSDNN